MLNLGLETTARWHDGGKAPGFFCERMGILRELFKCLDARMLRSLLLE